MSWQPIDTAPRDEQILLWGLLEPNLTDESLFADLDKPVRIAGHWSEIDEQWCISGSTWLGPWFKPTHWMPLPDPPGITEAITEAPERGA